MKANEKRALVAGLLANAANVAYASGTSYADVVDTLQQVHRFGSKDDYDKHCTGILCGRMVAYIERPPVSALNDRAIGKVAKDYAAQRWSNMTRDQRFEAAAAIIALAPSTSTNAERRSKFEDKAVAAARSFLSTARGHANIVTNRTGKGGSRKPRPSGNEPPRNGVMVATKFDNDNAAAEHFKTAAAALLATCDMNNQPGSKKEVKHIVHLVSSLVAEFKTKIDAVLKA